MAAVCLASIVAACGSSDDKKDPRDHLERPGDAGAAGTPSGNGNEAGTGAVNLGGAGGDGSDVSGVAGGGGVPAVPLGGADAGGVSQGGNDDELGGAGGSGGDSTAPFNGLYVGPTGDDSAAGSETEPFATLAHAASVAKAGDTIVFLDGTIQTTGQSVVIPAGVNLAAKNAGATTIVAQATPASLLTIQGDTRIDGLKFTSHQTVASFTGVGADPGLLTVADTQFVNCGSACLVLQGTAKAVVTPPANQPLSNGGYGFARVSDTAELSVDGGTLQNSNGGSQFTGSGSSKLTVAGASFVDGTGNVLNLSGQAAATFDGVTVAILANSMFQQAGTSQLTVTNSDVSMKPAVTPKYNCFSNTQNGVGSLIVKDSAVHDCGTGFKGSIPATLTLDNVEVHHLDFGADLGVGAQGVGGAITIDGCDFHDFGYTAFRAGSGSNLNTFVFRDTTFSNNVSSMWDMIILDASNASTLDFGTLADPGGNTFLNANTTVSALRIAMTAGYVSAVGNTWSAAQGADGTGHYAATGAGAKLEITTDVTGGQNYVKPYATTTLLLAQNP